jgi:protein-S-isoprenylcysteine O-methyltransferase Ste14
LSRTGRLRRNIKADVELLAALPADHPSRAALEAHIGELVATLVRRERRRFEPITPAETWFGVFTAIVVLSLVGVSLSVAETTRVYDPDTESCRLDWSAAVFYAALAVCFAWFAFAVWRRHGQQSDPRLIARAARLVVRR